MKPIVHYKLDSLCSIYKGRRATVLPVDHPSVSVSNTTHIITTPVKFYDSETGVFETHNTTYVPYHD